MSEPAAHKHFLRQIVEADLASGKHTSIVTRFPPEPNGYLHIGHAKSICLNFGLAQEYQGRCHLRMDDTNPTKEEVEYVDSIKEDVRWLGFDWGDRYYQASDYFDFMHECALKLIRAGKAYVCHLTQEQMHEYRGDLKHPGRPSPWRDRTPEENLAEFEKMREGFYEDGAVVLRAKIDMASPNMHLRDPALYRVRKAHHHNTGDKWRIYPMYDFAHPLEDAYEKITHSICTLEFEVHRPLYEWLMDNVEGLPARPRQYEFSRLNLTYTMMSKRKLLELVQESLVSGWDDPRMPTVSGLRRRGCTPAAIRKFCETIGVTRFNGLTEVALLEHAIREDLNKTSPRFMAVLNPLKVVIENRPEGDVEWLDAVNNPEDPAAGTRKVPFGRELYIERDDFMEDAPKNFYRLTPGREVRLRWGYFLKCVGVEKDAAGEIVSVRCTYDPATRGGDAPDGRKVKATIHWVEASHAGRAETRLYDRLFLKADLAEEDGKDWREHLNPDSLRTTVALVEPALMRAAPGDRMQFERIGYFCADSKDSGPGAPVFNRTVTLKDSFAKTAPAKS